MGEESKVEQTMEDIIRKIDKDVTHYQKKCRHPEKIHEVPVDRVLGYISHLSKFLADDEDHRFENSFLNCLKLVSVTAQDPAHDFYQSFNRLTKYLCNLCPKICAKVTLFDRVLTEWHQILESVSGQEKRTASVTHVNELKKCAGCMASVSTVSLQHKLLEIFRAYFEQDSKSPSDWMPELFKNIPLRIKDLHYYVNIDYGSFPKKDLLIHRLNQWLQEPNVFSEMALTVEIGSKVIAFENDDGFIHFNQLAKSVEFWIPNDEKYLKVMFRGDNVSKIQINDNATAFAMEMMFHLNSGVQIESADGSKVSLEQLQSKCIKIEFHVGFFTSRLQQWLPNMINKNAEIIWDSEQNSDEEDCIIVESETDAPKQIASKPVENDHPMKVEPTANSATSESAMMLKPSDLLREGLSPVATKKQRKPLSPRVSRKQPAPLEIMVSDVINLSNDATSQSSKEKSLKIDPISTRTFYSEEVRVDVHNTVSTATFHEPKAVASQIRKAPAKRTPIKRKAAAKAASNIKDKADDIFEFSYEEPKAKQKRVPLKAVAARKTKLSSPVHTARSPFKRDGPKQGRKLFNADELTDVEMIEEETPRQMNVPTNDELTGESFRGSFCANKKNQNQRVLANLYKINDTCGERRKASFSYRDLMAPNRELKNKQQADSTIVSDELNHFDATNDENMNELATVNNKTCANRKCDAKVIEGVQAIHKITNRILTALNNNGERNCRCETLIEQDTNSN